MRDTAINRVMKTSLSFIGDGYNSFTSIMDWNIKQELRNVTCSKHLVNSCESCCSLLRWKIRCKYTIGCALPPQELACTARWTCSRRCTVTGRCHRRNKQKQKWWFLCYLYKKKEGFSLVSVFFLCSFFCWLDIFERCWKRLKEVMILELGSSEMCTSELGIDDGGKMKKKWNDDGEVLGVFGWIL